MTSEPADLTEYLQAGEYIPKEVTPDLVSLSGGVSNEVTKVVWDGDCVVVKRPLAELSVDEHWPADVSRVHNEAAAARKTHRILHQSDFIRNAGCPNVRFEDETNHVVGFDCASEAATSWKEKLLAGDADPKTAHTVGEVLGEIHGKTFDRDDIESLFDHEKPFTQLRIDPYHLTVAERHPTCADAIRAEIERLDENAHTLVHGDYSPKNVLSGDRVWILDFEVAHWGDPLFDVAFMLNHLLIKATHHGLQAGARFDAFVSLAREFRESHRHAFSRHLSSPRVDSILDETALTTELAILMLARVDGKSPVQYPTKPCQDILRSVSKSAIEQSFETVTAVVDALEASIR
jgi:hypothetical protein